MPVGKGRRETGRWKKQMNGVIAGAEYVSWKRPEGTACEFLCSQ